MKTRSTKKASNITASSAADIRRATVYYDRRDILKKVPKLRKIKSGSR